MFIASLGIFAMEFLRPIQPGQVKFDASAGPVVSAERGEAGLSSLEEPPTPPKPEEFIPAPNADARAGLPETDRVEDIWEVIDARVARQADSWFDDGEYPKICQLFKFQYEYAWNDFDVAHTLGWMLENIDEYDEALKIYVDYRQRNPNDPDGPWMEAWFQFNRKKDYKRVVELLEPAIKNPKTPHPNSFRNLARAYEKLEKYADAERVLMLFLSKFPEDAQGKVNLERVRRKKQAK